MKDKVAREVLDKLTKHLGLYISWYDHLQPEVFTDVQGDRKVGIDHKVSVLEDDFPRLAARIAALEEQMAGLQIRRHKKHPDWNYTLTPKPH